MIEAVEKLKMLPPPFVVTILPLLLLLLLLLHMLSVGSDLMAVGVETPWYWSCCCCCLAIVFGLWGIVLKAPPVG